MLVLRMVATSSMHFEIWGGEPSAVGHFLVKMPEASDFPAAFTNVDATACSMLKFGSNVRNMAALLFSEATRLRFSRLPSGTIVLHTLRAAAHSDNSRSSMTPSGVGRAGNRGGSATGIGCKRDDSATLAFNSAVVLKRTSSSKLLHLMARSMPP